MPIRVAWDNAEKHLLYTRYTGNWTTAELHTAIEEGLQMMNEVQHRVDWIFDFTLSAKTASGNLLSIAPSLQRKLPTHRGVILVVGANHYYKVQFDLLQKRVPSLLNDLYFLDTLEEAFGLLERPWRSPPGDS